MGKNKDIYAWAGVDYTSYSSSQRQQLKGIRSRLEQRLSGKRLDHSISVALTARRLAASHGVDPFLAEAAGYLHDWDKKLPAEELWAKVESYHIPVSSRAAQATHILHGPTAAASLPEEFDLPPAVFQAIARHTVGAADMSDLDMLIYCADLLEPLRGDFCDSLRKQASGPLRDLFAACVAHTMDYLVQKRSYICVESIHTWNVYVAGSQLAR